MEALTYVRSGDQYLGWDMHCNTSTKMDKKRRSAVGIVAIHFIGRSSTKTNSCKDSQTVL